MATMNGLNNDYTKINFGCGSDLLEGFLNIDIVTPDNFKVPDGSCLFVFDMLDSQTLKKEHYELIKATMVFEHIHPAIIPTTIYTMACCLKVGGVIEVTVPDFAYFAEKHNCFKTLDLVYIKYMREAMFQILDPNFNRFKNVGRGHQSLWTKDMARFYFEAEGFQLKFYPCKENGILRFDAVKVNSFTTPVDSEFIDDFFDGEIGDKPVKKPLKKKPSKKPEAFIKYQDKGRGEFDDININDALRIVHSLNDHFSDVGVELGVHPHQVHPHQYALLEVRTGNSDSFDIYFMGDIIYDSNEDSCFIEDDETSLETYLIHLIKGRLDTT